MENFKESLSKEADEISAEFKLPASYRRKKLALWLIRTVLTIALYIVFWKYEWVRWTLLLYIPLSLFNLLALLGWNYFLKWNVNKLKRKVDQIS